MIYSYINILRKFFLILIFLSLYFYFFVARVTSQDSFEAIIGSVNEEALTTYELSQRIKILLNSVNLEDNIENRDKVRNRVLELMIEEKIKMIEAKNLELSASESEIEQLISQIFGPDNFNKNDFVTFLDRYGIDIEVITEQAKAELLWKKVLKKKFSSIALVSEEEIKAERDKYQKNIGENQINYSEILILKKNNSWDKAKNQINEIKFLLDKGVSFESLASKLSDSPHKIRGGNVGWVFFNQLEEEIRPILARSTPDSISNIIKTKNGFKIIKTNSKKKYGTKKQTQYSIINFSSKSDPEKLELFKNNVNSCDQDFDSLIVKNDIDYTKIAKIELGDFSEEIKFEIDGKLEGEKTKIFERKKNFFFFIVCEVLGEETLQIDDRVLENQIYLKKIQQLSRTHLNRLKKIANIKIILK